MSNRIHSKHLHPQRPSLARKVGRFLALLIFGWLAIVVVKLMGG